ncbi:hypothetical protein TrST_g13844 [Triparma strigata]|nr:hypothetical protein TrST_g13844 [Triparma strigata]
MTPSSPSFPLLHKTYYSKALVTPSTSSLNGLFLPSLSTLLSSSFLTPDVVLAGKSSSAGWSKTFVERTLVGEPGGTYKYLGLRIFANPWKEGDASGVRELEGRLRERVGVEYEEEFYEEEVMEAFKKIGEANDSLIASSKAHLSTVSNLPPSHLGSSSYTLTLINLMSPTSLRPDLKTDSTTSTQKSTSKTAVSWHTDSGLQDYSTISVWHHHLPPSPTSFSWKIALRPMPILDVSRKIPPLVYDLEPGGGVYYIFDDMNLRFEHAVLAGKEGERWSSTHRVVKEGGRLEDVLGECWRGVEDCRKMWRVMVVLEFDWICQWEIQGGLEHRTNVYWRNKFVILSAVLTHFERKRDSEIERLKKVGGKAAAEDWDRIIEYAEARKVEVEKFNARLSSKIYQNLPPESKPTFDGPLDEGGFCKKVRKWKKKYCGEKLTKKEKKGKGSNWEKMKSRF